MGVPPPLPPPPSVTAVRFVFPKYVLTDVSSNSFPDSGPSWVPKIRSKYVPKILPQECSQITSAMAWNGLCKKIKFEGDSLSITWLKNKLTSHLWGYLAYLKQMIYFFFRPVILYTIPHYGHLERIKDNDWFITDTSFVVSIVMMDGFFNKEKNKTC